MSRQLITGLLGVVAIVMCFYATSYISSVISKVLERYGRCVKCGGIYKKENGKPPYCSNDCYYNR